MSPVPPSSGSLSARVTLLIDSMNILLILSGEPPSHHLLQQEFKRTDYVVAVDGGLEVLTRNRIQPNLIVGDLDSAPDVSTVKLDDSVVHILEQDSTDLQKSLSWLAENLDIESLTLLGAGGGRTDHLVHNLQICALFDPQVPICLKNDHDSNSGQKIECIYRITPESYCDPIVGEGTLLSIFTLGEAVRLKTQGLKWDLNVLDPSSGVLSQSNISLVDKPELTLDSGYAYIAVYQ